MIRFTTEVKYVKIEGSTWLYYCCWNIAITNCPLKNNTSYAASSYGEVLVTNEEVRAENPGPSAAILGDNCSRRQVLSITQSFL